MRRLSFVVLGLGLAVGLFLFTMDGKAHMGRGTRDDGWRNDGFRDDGRSRARNDESKLRRTIRSSTISASPSAPTGGRRKDDFRRLFEVHKKSKFETWEDQRQGVRLRSRNPDQKRFLGRQDPGGHEYGFNAFRLLDLDRGNKILFWLKNGKS